MIVRFADLAGTVTGGKEESEAVAALGVELALAIAREGRLA